MGDPNDADLGRRMLNEGLLKQGDLLGALAPAAAPRAPMPARLGRYEILRLLGKGAAGEVYLARDPSIGREVAIKVLKDADFDQRFQREVAILGALRHPNIVALHDAGAQDGLRWFVMDRIEGRTLQDALQARDLPLRNRVAILRDVALACHAAHEKGVIHRDLKPSNILLDRQGRPFVTYFGIAKVMRAEDRMTLTGTFIGTPHYMSPEQAEGKIDQLDARSDVFSLGVILYEMLTGTVPFSGTTFLEIARRITADEPRRPSSIERSVPAELEAVTLKAIEKAPERRYANARALADDLTRWLAGRPVSARPPGRLRRLGRWCRRRPVLTTSLVASFAVLLALAYVQARNATQRRHERQWLARIEDAQRRADAELRAIIDWEKQLYKPPQMISYDELARSVARLDELIRTSGVPLEKLATAFYATARARILMGRTDLAMEPLARAIQYAGPKEAGPYRLERARVVWEILLREHIAKNEAQAAVRHREVVDDLREALRLGIDDPWHRDYAQALMQLIEKEKPDLEPVRGICERLRAQKEKPGEEVWKLEGDIALVQRDRAGALRAYEEALKIRQCYVQAKSGQAMAWLMSMGEGSDRTALTRSLECELQAVEMNPAYAETYHVFAVVCRKVLRQDPQTWAQRRDDYLAFCERIIPIFERGRRARPDLAAVALALGAARLVRETVLIAAKQPSEDAYADAVAALEAYLKLEPQSAEGYVGLGLAHGVRASELIGAKRPAELEIAKAMEALRRAAELDPKMADPHRWLGHVCLWKRETAQAIAEWEKAIELDPNLRAELEKLIDQARRGS